MFRLIFRILGFFLLVGAFISLMIDGGKSVASGDLILLPLGEFIANMGFLPALNAFQSGVSRTISPVLWDPVIVSILALPLWAVLGILALLFLAIGKKRRGIVEV